MYIPINFLRYDYALQTSLIILNVLLTVSIAFSFSAFILLLYYQFFLGIAQFVSALVHYFRPNLSPTIKRWRGTHLVVSLLLLATLAICVAFGIDNMNVFGNYGNAIAFWTLIGLIPQALAYSYYYLIRLDYKARRSYLDNRINFSS
jgi:uncharacterized membrane protein YhaH (DUF805 family)